MKLQAAFNSGAPPDVIELGSDWVAQFSSSGVLMQLPGDAGAVARFVPYSLAPGTWNKRIYAYPWTIDTRVIFVNTDLIASVGVRQVPSTIDEVIAVAEKLQDAGIKGWGANGADAHRLYKKILPLMWTLGGDVLDIHGRPTFYSPPNVAALEIYARLARSGMIETQRQLDAAFIQGKIGIWNSGSWLLKKIAATPSLRVTPILQPAYGTSPGVSFAGGEYLAVSASTGNTQMARELVQYLVDGANAVRFCQAVPEAGFPADSAFAIDPSLIKDPMKGVFSRQLSSARMTPVHPRWLDLEEILEDAVERVLLGEADPTESLARAQGEAEALLGRK
jgi:ABC-type glycerol-3-phosphate transport system substrate-binding protein